MIRIEHLSADVLELRSFARAAISGRIDPKLVHVPRTLEAIARTEDRFTQDERDELTQALAAGLAPLRPHVAVVDALRALSQPRSGFKSLQRSARGWPPPAPSTLRLTKLTCSAPIT